MSKRVGGFINQDGLNAPNEATGVSASAGDAQVTVSFTPPVNVGGSAVTGFVATSNDGLGATGSSSPITVSGLTNGTSYTFRVWALNAFGYSSPSDASGSVSPVATKGVFSVFSNNPGALSVQQIEISTAGTATDFGNLSGYPSRHAGCSSATRGLFGGGGSPSALIGYITIASAGDFTSFGNLTVAREYLQAASNSTRGVFGGGSDVSTNSNVIDYVTIASTGNATDFGDLTETQGSKGSNAVASPTRAVFAGGQTGFNTKTNVIGYVTIASTGNAIDFGDLIQSAAVVSGCSNSTRGVLSGGYPDPFTNRIEYITIASAGNSVDFGDLTSSRAGFAAMASATRAVFACGNESGVGTSNRIDYVTIASTGNAVDFGDALGTATDNAGVSSGHGGLS